MARGKFITFEGGEGAGKSTQVERLAAYLRARGVGVMTTREPGGTPAAEEIRALLLSGANDRWLPWSETLLHLAARLDHVHRLIGPSLARGEWVVSDRFQDSTLAYQGHGQGVGEPALTRLFATLPEMPRPDRTIVLDVPVEIGTERTRARKGAATRYDAMDPAVHAAIRAAFVALAEREPGRCVLIDACADADTVAAAVQAALAPLLGANP